MGNSAAQEAFLCLWLSEQLLFLFYLKVSSSVKVIKVRLQDRNEKSSGW